MTESKSSYDIGVPYRVLAKHTHFPSSNKIHTDELPQKLGFRGAFVLGVAIYGLMTRALVARFGEKWLGHAISEVKFMRPVCEGDRLRIETRPVAGREDESAFEVTAYNEMANDEISAQMQTSMPRTLPVPDPSAALAPNEWEGPVTQRRSWDNVITGRAYRSLDLTLSLEHNAVWQGILGEDVPIYGEGERPPIHPAHVLRLVQLGTNHECITEHAVHCSTKAVIRKVLRAGDPVRILTVPLAKWEKKQNQWITVYCAIRSGNELCAELFHTQIIRLRGAESPANAGTSAHA